AKQSRSTPVAPPAYRPQPTPKVLQRKIVSGQQTYQSQWQPRSAYLPERMKVMPQTTAAANANVRTGSPSISRSQSTPRVLRSTQTAQQTSAGKPHAIDLKSKQVIQPAVSAFVALMVAAALYVLSRFRWPRRVAAVPPPAAPAGHVPAPALHSPAPPPLLRARSVRAPAPRYDPP